MEIRISGNRVMRGLGDPRMVLFDCLLHIRLCFHFCIVLFVHISHTFIKYKQQKFEIQIPLPMSVALDAEHQRSSAYGKTRTNTPTLIFKNLKPVEISKNNIIWTYLKFI